MSSLEGTDAATPSELKARLDADRAGIPYRLRRDGSGYQQIV